MRFVTLPVSHRDSMNRPPASKLPTPQGSLGDFAGQRLGCTQRPQPVRVLDALSGQVTPVRKAGPRPCPPALSPQGSYDEPHGAVTAAERLA